MVDSAPVVDAASAAVLNELAAFGPHCALTRCDPASPPVPPWRPLAELIDDPALLRRRIACVRGALAATARCPVDQVAPPVAASLTQLGLVGRLLAPAIALAVLQGCWLLLPLERLWWQDSLAGVFPLALFADAALPLPLGAGATRVLDIVVAPVTAAVAAVEPVPVRALWGNVASVANSTAMQLARDRPALAPRAVAVAAELLRDARLRQERSAVGPQFRRSSCCLLAQIGAGAAVPVCGDCVLPARAEAERPEVCDGA